LNSIYEARHLRRHPLPGPVGPWLDSLLLFDIHHGQGHGCETATFDMPITG
jgi:hypothetical protein